LGCLHTSPTSKLTQAWAIKSRVALESFLVFYRVTGLLRKANMAKEGFGVVRFARHIKSDMALMGLTFETMLINITEKLEYCIPERPQLRCQLTSWQLGWDRLFYRWYC
jgi:hypothetical protein